MVFIWDMDNNIKYGDKITCIGGRDTVWVSKESWSDG